MRGERGTTGGGLPWGWVVALAAGVALYRLAANLALLGGDKHLLWNFGPVGALGLWVGARQRSRWAALVPVGAMLASDLLLIGPLRQRGYAAFSPGTPVIYAAFALYALLGRGLLARRESSPAVIGGAALLAGLPFFLVTNFAVWLSGGGLGFPRTLAGLLQCYAAAVPFYGYTVAGDLLFAGLFFGAEALARRVVALRKASQPS